MGSNLEPYRGLGRAGWLVAEVYAAEGGDAFLERLAADELALFPQRLHDVFLLHLGGTLHALGYGLL